MMDFPNTPTLNQIETIHGRNYKWNGTAWDVLPNDPLANYAGAPTIVTLGTVSVGTWQAGVITPAYGGTGLSSYTPGHFLYASGTTTLAQRSPSEVRSDIGLSNVENTALSTWTGSSNITTLGTITKASGSPLIIDQNNQTNVASIQLNNVGNGTTGILVTRAGGGTFHLADGTGNSYGFTAVNRSVTFSRAGAAYDAAPQSFLFTQDMADKNVVAVRAHVAQTANPLEVQNSAGAALFAVKSTGQLKVGTYDLTVNANATISGNNTGDQTTISGNAGTATKLQTARNLTIGSTAKSFDGSANVAWSLAEIGAAATTHSHVIGDVTGLQVALDGKVNAVNPSVSGQLTNTGTMRTGQAGEPGRWRFYDATGYLMSFWVTGTDFDTWGLHWDTNDNAVSWRAGDVVRWKADLDNGDTTQSGTMTSKGVKVEMAGNTTSADLTLTQPFYGRLNYAIPAANSRSEVRFVSKGSSAGNGQTYFVVASSESNDTGNNLLMGVSGGRVFFTNAVDYTAAGAIHLGGNSWASDGVVQIAGNAGTGSFAFVGNTFTINANTVWHAGNDGAASGLDADVLDGQQGSYYLDLGNATGNLSAARLPAFTGDVTSSAGTSATTIANGAVTLAKMANLATGSLIGRSTAGTGVPEVITVGSGLTLSGGVLASTGGGGTVTAVSVVTANGISGSVATPNSTPAITLTLGNITPTSVAASGTVTGSNLSGTNTGDQTTITGNAGTATTLQTARTIAISGAITGTATSFNGGSNITIPVTAVNLADAGVTGTLADARLSSNVAKLDANQTVTGTRDFNGIVSINSTAATSSSINGATASVISPKHTVSLFVGPTTSVSGYTANESSGNIRFNGSAIAWGDVGYYPTGTNDGNFRFSTTGSAINPVANASVGAGRYISTVAAGTAPFTVASNTMVSNLNVDFLDGQHGSYYQDLTNATGTLAAARLPAFTGDVTTVAGNIATTIAAGAVTLAKMANVGTGTVFYRKTAGTGAPETQTLATLKTDLGLTGTNSGDQTTITGNAGSATVLQTARTLTIGSTGKSFNGSANASWTLAEIGAPSTSGTGATGTWGISISGNAATANTAGSATTATTAATATELSGFTNTANVTVGNDVDNNAIGYVGSVSLFGQVDGAMYSQVYSTSWKHQIYGDYRTGQLAVRGKNNGTWQGWRTIWDSGNFDPTTKANTNNPTFTGTVTAAAISATSVAASGTVTGSNLSGTHTGSSSGTNTGDQTITLTGHVTGTGTGSFATTIANGVITNAMQANMPANTLSGNNTAGAAAPSDLTAAQVRTMLNVADGATANTGTVTNVSVTTANGVSGTVANSTTTPAITLTLGAITPTSVTTPTVSLTSGGTAWSTTSQGSGNLGAIHLAAGSAQNSGNAITFGGYTGANAQAGIYTAGNSSTGTSMYLSTTNSYAAGPQTAIAITPLGAVSIPRAGLTVAGAVQASNIAAGASVSGTNTGDQTTITGNAGSATVLQTARTINGVSFNGSANITIAAASPNSLTAGNGLTGTAYNGSAAQTFALGTPSTITSATTNSVTSTSHTHALSVTKADVGLGNVENVALSSWAGSSSLTTIGTLSAGTVPWARLGSVPAIGSSGLTMGTGKLLGRATASSGAVEEITIGSGLSLSAGVLSATPSGTSWNVIGAAQTLAEGSNYIVTAAVDVTLPAAMSTGSQIVVHSKVSGVRVLSNSNVITGVGSGNDLIVGQGQTVILVASASGVVEVV